MLLFLGPDPFLNRNIELILFKDALLLELVRNRIVFLLLFDRVTAVDGIDGVDGVDGVDGINGWTCGGD